MHIIITDSKHSRVHSFQLGVVQLVLLSMGVMAMLASVLFAWWPSSKDPVTSRTPDMPALSAQTIQQILGQVPGELSSRSPPGETQVDEASLLQQNINALAKRLGVMQARMIQLDALSARLAELAGLPEVEAKPKAPDEGGILIDPESMSAQKLSSALDALTESSEEQLAWLSVIEDKLIRQEWAGALTPGRRPVDDLLVGSPFGRRIDPITGQMATHTGLDFPGPVGTPVKASAGGIVVAAQWHAGYGRLVEIEHGDGVLTRYAHLSALKVAKGDVVKPGQVIGLLGNSGRSTGPHLHFEVWVAGRVRNPATYLRDHAHMARAP